MTSPAHFRLGERPALDGLRAIAVAFVVLVHYTPRDPSLSDWFRGGFIGVEVFFVLSGFLITSLVLAEFEDTGSWQPRRFFRRRAFRLVPALYCMAVICALIGATTQVPRFGDASNQPVALFAAATYVLNLITGVVDFLPLWSVPLWSLCVEVHFYLLWPPLLVAAAKRGPAFPARLALGIIVASLLARIVTFATLGAPYQTILTPNRLDGLALGGLIAIALHRGWNPGPSVRFAGPAGLIGLVVVLVLGDANSWVMVVFGYTVVDLCTAAVLLDALDRRSSTGRFLDVAPLRKVGQWSYSLYLWHLPVIAILSTKIDSVRPLMVGAALGTVLIAGAAATFIEAPLRKLGRTTRPSVAAGT